MYIPPILAQVLPSLIVIQTAAVVSANGSSVTGHCTNTSSQDGFTLCHDPATSVLFDGYIPTLSNLDGDTWASQLLTLDTSSAPHIIAEFPEAVQLRRVEVVLFNCPEWGIAIQSIGFVTINQIEFFYFTITSCDSLVRICLELSTNNTFGLLFLPDQGVRFVHLAEILFVTDSGECPPSVLVPPTNSGETGGRKMI